MSDETVNRATLASLSTAFARLDLEAVVNAFAEDGEFVNVRGTDPFGERYVGRARIREFFGTLFKNSPDLTYETVEPDLISADRAVWQWRRRATTPDGKFHDCLGCDLFTFENGLVKRKDAYFKMVVASEGGA